MQGWARWQGSTFSELQAVGSCCTQFVAPSHRRLTVDKPQQSSTIEETAGQEARAALRLSTSVHMRSLSI